MYKIIVPYFTDLKDKNRKYKYGDTYPAIGVKATKERIEELASTNNKAKMIIIKKENKEPEIFNEENNKENKIKEDETN